MAVKTMSDLVVESFNTGSDPIFVEGGVTYSFNPQGLKDFIGGDIGPTVESVNGKTGIVVLSAQDVGAAVVADIPTGRKLVPDAGTDGQVLKIVSGTPAWSADTNTTYTAMTAAIATAGTSTTANTISAKVLSDAISERVVPAIGTVNSAIVDIEGDITSINNIITDLTNRIIALEGA